MIVNYTIFIFLNNNILQITNSELIPAYEDRQHFDNMIVSNTIFIFLNNNILQITNFEINPVY